MFDTPRRSHHNPPIHIRSPHELRPPPLPRPLTSFIGRDRERHELATLIISGAARLLTLVGPAGVGKTRLAVQLAADLQSEFDAVGFTSLASLTDPSQIVPAAGNALGIGESTIERLDKQLGGVPVLLVLDNLEQIPGAAAVLASLLASCSSLILMATSRTVLHVSGEVVYPVSPFDTSPEPATLLIETPAIQLFAARAHAADPVFTLDELSSEVVARICHRLDGLPLAIELAAGQTRTLSPRAILARLDQRFDVLSHGPQDQPERLQSLERAIRWSYDLLSPTEQRAFRRSSVFSGGFTEEGARHVLLDGKPALAMLSALVDASLLKRTVQSDGESRFSLLETIREFCLLELRASGEELETRQTHAAYYLQLAAHAEPRLIVVGSAEWVRRLGVEYANLRDAVEWSLAAGEPAPVLALAGTLLSMAYARGEPAESLSWLERAIVMAGPTPSPLVCDALFVASALAQVQGEFDRSVELATSSLAMARATGYAFGEGRALLGLGIGSEWAHRLDEAEEHYRAARAIMQTLDSTTRLAHWRVLPVANLADIALIRHNYREAIELGSEAVASWRKAGYLWGIAQALGTVAAARCELGDLAGARRDYRETLDLWINCDDGRGIAGTIAGIAAVAFHSADAAAAATLLGAAWQARTTLGLDYVAHHLYAEQIRAAVLAPATTTAQLAAAEARGRTLSRDEALDATQAVLATEPRSHPQPSLMLSAREREVLNCIRAGMHDREIAEQLSISPRTVQSHVLGIFNKLGARSRAEAVGIATRNDLL